MVLWSWIPEKIRKMIFRKWGGGGSKAVGNFSENSSNLVAGSFPKSAFQNFSILKSLSSMANEYAPTAEWWRLGDNLLDNGYIWISHEAAHHEKTLTNLLIGRGSRARYPSTLAIGRLMCSVCEVCLILLREKRQQYKMNDWGYCLIFRSAYSLCSHPASSG